MASPDEPGRMTSRDESELLAVAREAAGAAASELVARFGRRHEGVRSKSSPTDLVSDADLAAERAIRDVLGSLRPSDAILGEEGGETAGDGELRWVIDPLDGTTNFLFGIPQFAVSIACEDELGTLAGVVLDPVRDESFTATRSGVAMLDGVEIAASTRAELSTALVATGFGYEAEVRAAQARVLAAVLPRVRDIRRAGSAALDLAWCGCGRLDCFYERGLKRWDWAAGGLIAARAGLEVVRLRAHGGQPPGVLAAPPALVDELIGLIAGG